MIEESRTYRALAFAGTLPFLAGAVMAIAGIESFGPFGSAVRITSSYGLAILCFLCGAHWGTYLYHRDESPFNLFLTSNAVVVVVWLAHLTALPSVALGLQMVAFLYLLYIDRRLLQTGIVSSNYFTVRTQATTAAVIALLIVIYASFA